MPPPLVLHFLGLPQIHLDDRQISMDRRKAIALLAYLAVNDLGRAHQKYSREVLSALFWPDHDQSKAFSNLRTIIWDIRQTIGEGWLLADRESVQLNRDAEIDLDVARFRELLSQGHQQNDPALRIPLLSNAVKLYRSHFLTGFSLKDAPGFNDWAFAESEELRRQFAEALTMLSQDHCALGQPDQAVPYARRLISLDPLDESAHRHLMEVYWQASQQNAALKQYRELEQLLRKELNLDPQPETRELYKKIRKGELASVRKSATSTSGVSQGTAEAGLPTGTVTFLFTDIESSTKLAAQYPDAMPELLTRQHEILTQALKSHYGYVFQVVGDSHAAAFHSVRDALAAAVVAQQLLQQESWSPVPIKVRMAIHTGMAQLETTSSVMKYSNYATLALTQRIMSTGHGGQVLLSQAAHVLARTSLPEGVDLRDLGEYYLKDFAQTEHIYQLMIPGLSNEFPPLRISDAHPNNLPVQLSTFIGREKEQAEIVNLIAGNRLLTLAGVGGIGKTRLSLEAARQVLHVFRSGVWFIELAALSDPVRVPQTVSKTLGLIEQGGRSHLEILADFLHSRRALLILDNCEHLIQACAQFVQALLNSCPDLHILATSREALGVPGEVVYLVPTLTTPDPVHTTLETFSTYEATQLFIERAQSALPGFKLTRENLPVIARLCRHLDGIPLAIELAAARVRLLSVEEINARLDDRFRLLTGGARTALPRHQTLQALIDWSHDLLSEPERVLLRRLSVFAGGWTLEAAEQVTGNGGHGQSDPPLVGSNLQIEEALDLLTSLVNKSLISVERQPGQETRYDMLETIRQYANGKLWQADEAEQLRQRHLVYYVDIAEQAEPNLRAHDMVMWLDRLETEHENIRSALAWALERNIEAALRLASALLWFWHIRGHKNEGVEWLERALAVEAMEKDVHVRAPHRAIIRGKALNAAGSLMVMNHEFGKAPPHLEESLALFQGLGPAGKQGAAYALLRLAQLPSKVDQAESMLKQSLAVFREIGDTFGVTEALMQLSGLARKDNHEQAVRFAEEELALSRQIGDLDGIAVTLISLADLTIMEDDYPKASLLYTEGLAIFHMVKNRGAFSMTLGSYGNIFFWQGAYDQAARTYAEAFVMAQELGYKFLIASNLFSLGTVDWLQGDYRQAAQKIGDSHPMFRAMGHDWLASASLQTLGDIALATGNEERAAQWYEEELAFGREAQIEVAHLFALQGLGKVAWAQGQYDQAARRFEQSLEAGRKARLEQSIFHSLYGLGRAAQSRGDFAAAREHYVAALRMQRRRIQPLFNWVWMKTYSSSVSYPLEGLAVLARAQEQMGRAARLFGAAEGLYSPIRFAMSAAERAEHDEAIAAARTSLGEEAFSVLYEEGRNMSLQDAVSYAQTET